METLSFAGFQQSHDISRMFRLLQRMDDTEPRLPAGGVQPPLRSLTVLADPNETETEALEDWARGLDWVQWLLSSIRQRMEHLHCTTSRPASEKLLCQEWSRFTENSLTTSVAPHFREVWQAVHSSNLQALLAADAAFSKSLSAEEAERSVEAGRLLLKATNKARYQGLLGHYRNACENGTSHGHFLTLWAAVADFFQLSLASAIAEYLRLEWAMATRHLPVTPELVNLPQITAAVMRPQATELRVMA
jgi:hypothetical protein